MSEEKNKKYPHDLIEKIPVFLFYLALSIELIIVLIDKSAFINPVEGRLFQITFLLFCMKIASTKYSLKEWFIILIFGLVGMVSYCVTGRNELIRIVVFLASCKGIMIRKAMIYTFYVTFLGVLSLILLSLAGLLGTTVKIADYGRGAVETRYTLGIGHPNALHCMVWAIMILGIYLYHRKITWYVYALLFLMNLGLYQLTLSKAGVLIGAFTIFCSVVIRYLGNRLPPIIISLFCYFTALMAFVFSFLSAISNTDPAILKKIDQYLTNRIMLARYLGGTQYWSLFSSPQNTEYFDMGFVRLFYWYGIIPTGIMLLVLLLMIRKLLEKKEYWALMMIMSFCIYTVVEAHAVSVYLARNYVLFILGSIWSELLIGKYNSTLQPSEQYLWEIIKR